MNVSWDRALGAALVVATCMLLFFAIATWPTLKLRLHPAQLNSPVKRVAGLLLIMSLVLLVVGLTQIANDVPDIREFYVGFLKTIFFVEPWRTERFWPALYGFYGTFISALFSYFYDPTIGRGVSWIRHG